MNRVELLHSGSYYIILLNLMGEVLAGWWHGANWTFVAWGGYYGLLLCFERILHPRGVLERLPATLQRTLTLFLVMMGWVLFRSQTFSGALRYYGMLFSPGFSASHLPGFFTIGVLATGILAVFAEAYLPLKPRFTVSLALGFAGAFLGCLVLIFGNDASPFIYFQF